METTPATTSTPAPPAAAPASSLPPPRRRRWVTVLLALVVFFSGLFIGAAGTLAIVWRQVQIAIHHPELMPQRLAGRLAHRLDLTPDQESRVREIIAKHQTSIQQIRREAQPRIETELHGVHDEVSGVLNPQQSKKWDTLYSDMIANWFPTPPGTTSGPQSKGE